MMEASGVGLWAAVVALGAFHGANPSMGWLFAVSNAMFERRQRALFAALPPIALGHLLAMALVLLPVAVIAVLAARFTEVRVVAGSIIIVFGVYRLIVRRHPRALARIGPTNLTLWSFVMATAHGAALMLVPVYLGMTSMLVSGRASASAATSDHGAMMATMMGPTGGGLALAAEVASLHTGAMLAVAAAIAWVFYRFVGVSMLRQVWFNVDIVWAAALIAAGAITIAMS